jgi:biopolymer transport protein ExbD
MADKRIVVPSAEPNVTPMIDVLLVLLITFMVLAACGHKTMDAALPEPCRGVCENVTSIVLEVLPGPTYRINQVAVAPGGLRERLMAIYANRPEKIIHVAGGRGVSYADVIEAMDIARSAGVRLIGITPKEVAAAPR